ncbi:patatin-like phospholipase family protein [Desulfurobacterium atlanticum]|uniref:NTE family protein n=1 Tax=Desulfurobacterium atlanticum TaxID=240169 RepID=A0A238ZZ34_9BACT|nr:patatin-like phospholipase family protein [Desulfurobacterium atlanticum]SNR88281.1 NTE family protein [Desulfurobacterium atlanticum]
MKKIGVALSGGFLRGIAHAGFLKGLEQKGISPAVISGASAGAIVGALYAHGFSPEKIGQIARELNWKKLATPSFKGGLFKLTKLKTKLEEFIGDVDIKDLKIPFALTVVELKTLKTKFVTEGKASDWIVASCSIPPLFAPWKIDGNYYIDGGIRNSMPAEFPKAAGCDIVIGSSVHFVDTRYDPESLTDVALRVGMAQCIENETYRAPFCDIVVNHYLPGSPFDFNNVENFFKTGYENGIKVAEEVKKWL